MFIVCMVQILMGQDCSEKADIYSLGVILWEIITGEHPRLRCLRPFRWARRAALTGALVFLINSRLFVPLVHKT